MGSRAGRAVSIPSTWHALPTLDHPQWVDSDGHEVDEAFQPKDEFSEDYLNGNVDDGGAEGEDVLEITAAGLEEDEPMIVDEQEEGLEEVPDEDQKVEVLSLAESLVLNYSLVQTRQQHIRHLLPRVLSHPPIPSHSKPRAKGPPKSTFLFPTPPPPAQPLPLPEYHGPSQPQGKAAPTSDVAKDSQDATGSTPSPARKEKKKAVVEAPAHELDCIARVTLSIGPISYPGTELWVGRFVEPRVPSKDARVKGPQTERKRSLAEDAALRRSRMPKQPVGQPGRSPLTGFRPPSAAGASSQVRPTPIRPAGGAGPPKPGIDPNLITMVNQAATRNPWLLTIIHKAAKNEASREELAKLGRVVARLSKGEGVGEGPEEGITRPLPSSNIAPPVAKPPATTAPPGPSTTPAPTVTGGTTKEEDSDLSDSEVDMKGPRQVGGGPGPDPSLLQVEQQVNAVPAESMGSPLSSAPSTPLTPASSLPPMPSSDQVRTDEVKIEPSPATTSTYVPMPQLPPLPPIPAVRSPNTIFVGVARPPSTPMPRPFTPSSAPPRPSMPPAVLPAVPPPPPRPQYPTLPRFLMVAFKDAQTEKCLIPLGALSYVSRVGGDYVTSPPPPLPIVNPPVQATPIPAVTPVATPVASSEKTPEATMNNGVPPQVGTKPGRTRQSLGRSAKEPEVATKTPSLPPPTTKNEPTPIVEVVPEKRKEPPSSGLKPLPGEAPAPGTVLISTLVPAEMWDRPKWNEVEKGLPWVNRELMQPRPVKDPVQPGSTAQQPESSSISKASTSPERELRRHHPIDESKPKPKPSKPRLLNFGCTDLLPGDAVVYPVTIRLEGINDQTWRKFKLVMDEIEGYELKHLAEEVPELIQKLREQPEAQESIKPIICAASHLGFSPREITALRELNATRKRERFARLLKSTPMRSFLRYRVPAVDPAIADAMADKWAPRPYPMSTKPLYTTNAEEEDDGGDFYNTPLSPERPAKRKKGAEEPTVTFEMPISLDALDERVEEGARLSLSKGRSRGKGAAAKTVAIDGDGKKRYGQRSRQGVVCEGCGLAKKVWRQGPNGRGTLCMACGDKFVAGTLGELLAPGAASQKPPEAQDSATDSVKGEDIEVAPSNGDEMGFKIAGEGKTQEAAGVSNIVDIETVNIAAGSSSLEEGNGRPEEAEKTQNEPSKERITILDVSETPANKDPATVIAVGESPQDI